MRKTRDVLSVEWVKLELIRTAYATRGGLLSTMDPRMVLLWYAITAFAPWFTHNLTTLIVFFVIGMISVAIARVGPLVLGLFIIGLVFEIIYLFLAALFFGGNTETLIALGELNLKLGAISMFSMAAFVSLDPEKLSDALLSLRAPHLLAFGISYGYRMLPILVEEFTIVFENYRMRTAPAPSSFLGWRAVVQWVTMATKSFYPIFLNTAKSVRTTVEALEARGFTYATMSDDSRKLRLSYLKVTSRDVLVILVTILLVAFAFWAGKAWPLYR